MQVNNNIQSPNFGMALKIDRGGSEYLAKQSVGTLRRLQEVGKEMKDYKYWDLFVSKDGYTARCKPSPCCYGPGLFFPEGDFVNKQPNRIKICTYVAENRAIKSQKVDLIYNNANEQDIEKLKQAFSFSNPIDLIFAEFVRFLERRSADIAANGTPETRINCLVDDLVSKFSVDI